MDNTFLLSCGKSFRSFDGILPYNSTVAEDVLFQPKLPPEPPGGFLEPTHTYFQERPEVMLEKVKKVLQGRGITYKQKNSFLLKISSYKNEVELKFHIRIFTCRSSWVLEFQRRKGCCLQFSKLYRSLVEELNGRKKPEEVVEELEHPSGEVSAQLPLLGLVANGIELSPLLPFLPQEPLPTSQVSDLMIPLIRNLTEGNELRTTLRVLTKLIEADPKVSLHLLPDQVKRVSSLCLTSSPEVSAEARNLMSYLKSD